VYNKIGLMLDCRQHRLELYRFLAQI